VLDIFFAVPYTAIEVLERAKVPILAMNAKTVAFFSVRNFFQPGYAEITARLISGQILVTIVD